MSGFFRVIALEPRGIGRTSIGFLRLSRGSRGSTMIGPPLNKSGGDESLENDTTAIIGSKKELMNYGHHNASKLRTAISEL